ncbi:MAG TPA: hypothetical protein DIT48_01115 [Actinobacteria bacterium]|jgi:uncharacterized protein YutE (UPF0331/DUF86 family)/predicted nucleotidyltransferase|nr:hypothetical protein [Actinomycetota bacterium]HCP62555.1 hypothetical protein [Actinomycetota bacterium]
MSAAGDGELAQVFRDAGIAVAYLFGSRATGTAREDSDADVAVLTGRPLGLLGRERLSARLARALRVPDVDVVVLEEALLELRGRAIQEGKLLYSDDEPRRVAFEVRTRSEYFDFLPTLQELTRAYLEHVAARGSMVDSGRLRTLLGTLAVYRMELSALATLSIDEYLSRSRFAGRYLVQAAAQTCIDIANHVVAAEGWRTPRDFRDAFTVLEEHDVLAQPLADRLRDLAGLRNRLVHLYQEDDDRLIHAALPASQADLDAFARAIAELAAAEGETNS